MPAPELRLTLAAAALATALASSAVNAAGATRDTLATHRSSGAADGPTVAAALPASAVAAAVS